MLGGTLVRNARIVSGLILLIFVTGHLANLILGLHSLAAMEAARPYLMGPWRSTPGIVLLAGAAIVHTLLGITALASRRSLAVSKTDVVQLLLGFVTPPLLIGHAFAMHIAGQVTPNFGATFGQVLAIYWSFAPSYAIQQVCVVMVVWMHAAIGLYSWLVLKPVWQRIGGLVLPLLFAIPILALLGFAEAGKEVIAKLAAEPDWRAMITANLGKVSKATREFDTVQARVLTGYGVLVIVAIAFLTWRIVSTRLQRVTVAYDEGLSAKGRRGLSILELSLLNHVPHAHVCSGRARCGTCRVRVEAGAEQLSPVQEIERKTLDRVHAGAGERLACQAQVLGAGVSVTRVLPAFADASAARAPEDWKAEAST
jgi:adenylate cyclase